MEWTIQHTGICRLKVWMDIYLETPNWLEERFKSSPEKSITTTTAANCRSVLIH